MVQTSFKVKRLAHEILQNEGYDLIQWHGTGLLHHAWTVRALEYNRLELV